MAKKKAKRPSDPLSGFKGRVELPPFDALSALAGVKGASQVWFPKTKADVATAVVNSKDRRTLVRSGLQAATANVADAAGGVVIHLAALKKVGVRKSVLSAEAAATTSSVAEQLTQHGLALPLLDSPLKSIASNVLEDEPSCLIRTLGPLSKYITKISGVSPAGKSISRSGATAINRIKEENAVVTGVTFKPAEAKDLWMFRKSFPYPGKELFASLVKSIFLNPHVPAQADVVLDAMSSRYDIPIVRITAAGSIAADEVTVTSVIEEACTGFPAELSRAIVTQNFLGSDVLQPLVEAGVGVPNDPEVEAHRIRHVLGVDENTAAFLNDMIEDVDRGLAFREDGTGKKDKNLRVFMRLQLNREDRLSLSGYLYTSKPPAPALPPRLASVALMMRTERPLHAGLELTSPIISQIPNFRGDIYIPSDLLYGVRAHQYATSSYKKADMTPFMIAYPLDEADIAAAITFARANQKRIVARSGGHQYSGMSSGGNATIVLAMDMFNQLRDVTDNVIDVGPAVPLTSLASKLAWKECTVPHGECPLVCIGGHAQTGGFGHLLRSFGLTLDYVMELTIVLADGSVRTLQRPNGAPATDNDELFWGVLGGNAGSFGIVTNYRFRCIKDDAHPNSYGYSAIRPYEKARYKGLMKEVQLWTQGVAAGTFRTDVDFMMTVESESDALIPPFPTLLVEAVHSNLSGPGEVVNGDQVFRPIIDGSNAGTFFWERFLTTQGPQHLSELSDSFVRRPPFTTLDGREFKYPYKKRINCTTNSLTDAFVDQFVNLVDKVVMATDGVYLVFQMLIGGGSLQDSARRAETSIPRRDFVFCFIFDLFYDDGKEQIAIDLQNEMQSLINTHFSVGQEQRLLWGSFGDPDMAKPAVRDLYYDDAAVYARLQQLKMKVDPDDIFHSLFTVKLP